MTGVRELYAWLFVYSLIQGLGRRNAHKLPSLSKWASSDHNLRSENATSFPTFLLSYGAGIIGAIGVLHQLEKTGFSCLRRLIAIADTVNDTCEDFSANQGR